MTIEYTKRALIDLEKVSAESRTYGAEVAAAAELHIQLVIDHIQRDPGGAPRLDGRPGVHVIPLFKLPYKLFYRITGNTVRILHIRHTSRRSW